MTLSLIARDPETGMLGGVAATGNLCVGGWVLRGDARGGVSASQGRTPSTLWGEDSLAALVAGDAPQLVADRLAGTDSGRSHRQLALIDVAGRTAVFEGEDNHPFTGHRAGPGWVVAGNWLSGPEVIEATSEGWQDGEGCFAARLLRALEAGTRAGSDRRGTLSAAILVVGLDRPPLTLRVDHSEDPVAELARLYEKTREQAYLDWLATVPTRAHPEKA